MNILNITESSLVYVMNWFESNHKSVALLKKMQIPQPLFENLYFGFGDDRYFAFYDKVIKQKGNQIYNLYLCNIENSISRIIHAPFYICINDGYIAANVTKGNDLTPELAKEFMPIISEVIIPIFYFLSYNKLEIKEFEENINSKNTAKNQKLNKSKKGKKTIKIPLEKIVKKSRENVHCSFNNREKCKFSFSVRGHYRHLKSGKTVFIKPYKKNRGKPERDSIYRI